MDVDKYYPDKYCIIIASHEPKIDLLFDMLTKLSKLGIGRIFLVDSSSYEVSKSIQLFVENLNARFKIQKIFYEKVVNRGVGHKYNMGFKLCLKNQCKVMTIFTDDAIIDESTFNPEKIINFFYSNLDINKDVLALTSWNRGDYGTRSEIKEGPDFGMTLSNYLVRVLTFNENLILDYNDFDFCYQIKRNGGKIKLYPQETVTSLPSGSKTSKNIPHLPVWRIYLVVRNYLDLSCEYRDVNFFIRNTYHAIGYMISSCFYGEKLFNVFKAAFLGILDSTSGKLGITDNLQRLTNDLFCKKEES